MKTIVDFIPDLPQKPYRNGFNKPEGIVGHSTGILQITNDTVERNRRVFTSAYVKKRGAFVHFFVDHLGVWQAADLRYRAAGAGSKSNPRHIHIELCDTKNPEHFAAAYKNYINLIVSLMRKYGWKPQRRGSLWTHGEVAQYLGGTNHNDPAPLFRYHGLTIDQFYKDVQAAYDGKTVSAAEPAVKWGAGMTKSQIIQLQRALMKLGYDLSKYGDDGMYGKETANAVMIYERRHDIPADGHADPAVLKSILEAAAALKPDDQKPAKEVVARLVSGTFANEEDRNATADKLAKETGWKVYKSGCKELRIATGIFKTEASIRKAKEIMEKYMKVVYVKYE